MIVRPWELGDTQKINIQSAQEYMYAFDDLINQDLTPLADENLAVTIEEAGKVLLVGGVFPQWENRALLWALVDKDAGEHFVNVHRETIKFLNRMPFRRIEATVDVGFSQGCRWMSMLGFEIEGYMKAYRPDGADMLLYARVKDVVHI